MDERDFPSKKEIIKRTFIVLTVIFLLFGALFLNKYYDDKREREIEEVIKNAMSNTEEESKEESSTEEQELIDEFEYVYDENNKFTVGIFKGATGNISVHAFCHYSEENMGLMQNDFMFIWMYPYTEGFDISATISLGESTYFYLMSNGELLWNDVPLEPMEDMKENYLELFEKMRDELIEFYKYNGIIIK